MAVTNTQASNSVYLIHNITSLHIYSAPVNTHTYTIGGMHSLTTLEESVNLLIIINTASHCNDH